MLLVVAAGVVLAFLAGVAPWRDVRRRTEPAAEGPTSAPVDPPVNPPSRDRPAAPRPGDTPPGPEANDDPSASGPLAALADESGRRWAMVDMTAVRAAMPDNLYWTMSVPTKDPTVLRQREEERERWNAEYGKVLSGTATEQEVRAYYTHRQRLSIDYVEFATHLLTHYGQQLPEQDVGMLKLAVKLHLARLEEIPRQIAESVERSKAHDAARQAWIKEQEAFEGKSPAAP